MMRSIRKAFTSGSKKRSTKKMINHKGGALYSFDLLDKIGGLPARMGLNGTSDGDCPKGNVSDFGMNNYTITNGGSRKHKKNKLAKSKKSKSRKSISKKSGKKSNHHSRSKMNHSKMNHSKMNHSKMNHKKSKKSKSSKKSNSRKH